MVLEVVCPTCGGMKNLSVPANIITQKKFGTIKIQVPIKVVCPEHQFLVFVDTRGKIRGYEKIDIQMVSITREDEKEKIKNKIKNNVKEFLTRLNFI